MTATPTAPDVSIHDFTLTVVTRESSGDKLVCRLDRDGESITMVCGTAQLMWVIEDPELFTGWYAQAVAARTAAAAAPEPATVG